MIKPALYTSRPVLVRAFQYKKGYKITQQDLKDAGVSGISNITVTHTGEGGEETYLQIQTEDGSHLVLPGQWLVLMPDGFWKAEDEKDFYTRYKPVEGDDYPSKQGEFSSFSDQIYMFREQLSLTLSSSRQHQNLLTKELVALLAHIQTMNTIVAGRIDGLVEASVKNQPKGDKK